MKRNFAYLSAVGQSTRPLAGDGPLVVARHLATEAASSADVLIRAHLQSGRVEDLVVVGVEQQVPHARAPLVPGSHALKGVVEGNSDVGVLEVSPAVHVELANGVHVERRAKRLVQQLDRSNIGVVRKVVTKLVECFEGQLNGVALGPFGSALKLAGVVETVLRSRSAVKIEHHLDTVVACPANCFSNIVVGAIYERSSLAAND